MASHCQRADGKKQLSGNAGLKSKGSKSQLKEAAVGKVMIEKSSGRKKVAVEEKRPKERVWKARIEPKIA
jgi:hypothetical protein